MSSDVRPKVVSAVEQLAQAGLRTYVVSLAANDADANRHLQLVAAAGGTGQPAYVPLDRAQLEAALRKITGSAPACDLGMCVPRAP